MSDAVLDVRALTKTFSQAGTPLEILRGLSLQVTPGETVAVLGASGSGKSTLLALLAGLDRPTSGEVRIRGQDLGSLSEEALTALRAREIGIVFQQFHLMSSLTALENVSLPLELQQQSDAFERARDALAKVGLGARENHFPAQLSGGERQRVAIARALAIRPAILLADEPSGNLDETTGQQVMNVLFDLVQTEGATLILVTHDQTLAQLCRRRLRLHDGRLDIQS
jgi:putative ABC transport system ATP-binding protein